MLIALSNVSNLFQNGQFSIFSACLGAIFVTIVTIKVKSIQYFDTWAIVLLNQ